MRMRQFHPRETGMEIQSPLQELQLDSEAHTTHDDLYARAWEIEYFEPVFDNDKKSLTPQNTRDIIVESKM